MFLEKIQHFSANCKEIGVETADLLTDTLSAVDLLLANAEIKKELTSTAWKPTFSNASDTNRIEVLCKRVRGILNKLTPTNFDSLLQELKTLNIDTQEKLSNVISLIIDKAADEPIYSSLYAMLCQKLGEMFQNGSTKQTTKSRRKASSPRELSLLIFKKELLNKCQREFDDRIANENFINSQLLPLQNELNEAKDYHRKVELAAKLVEEEHKLRRRSVGIVRFIGELYKQNLILTSIMEWCIKALLKIRTEEKLEYLCQLLTTVGQQMELKTHDDEHDRKYCRDLTAYFQTMQQVAYDREQRHIRNRIRFMLMDLIELRENNWMPRRTDEIPNKIFKGNLFVVNRLQ